MTLPFCEDDLSIVCPLNQTYDLKRTVSHLDPDVKTPGPMFVISKRFLRATVI